ncbi:NAD(P)-dependent oxidoreductase [Methylobacterium pseudosasicola]|uniref:3-hydroxyisobutyrate dehydrogenase n=1 Tax=Methylobacterium pseudosasicola TaxID=582667 RepID=A0A1I4ICR3_9HYPH|nr:NAD(P)-dependent oxidoreductase [Methylobacterium pseudosasicola]SFL52085.1 3-hydroxyisobutyrate dehydrogenase [Methylobacterium pseudosasicola]
MTDRKPPVAVTVLGTGLIGAAVSRNLARKGFRVRVWNRTPEKARALAADGAEPVDRAADAVRGADIVVTVLKDGPAVREAMTAALPGLPKGAIWLQLSTVGVGAIEALAGFSAENTLVLYDAPVQGTRQPAEQGRLVILASGPVSRRPEAQTVFDAVGQRTLWVSEAPGGASRLKLALNAFVFALTHGTAESLAIAKVLGLNPALVIEAVTGGPLDSPYVQAKGGAMLNGDYATSFSVANGLKDAGLVVEALAGTGIRADLAEAGLARFRRADQAGHGGKDIAASFLV